MIYNDKNNGYGQGIMDTIQLGDIAMDESIIPMEEDLTADGPPISEDGDSHQVEIQETFQQKSQRWAKMILPHIGLVILLAVYTLVGAGVFHLLELPNEIMVRGKIFDKIWGIREDFMTNMWNKSQNMSTEADEWKVEAGEYFDQLSHAMLGAYTSQFILRDDIMTNNTERHIWTFEASIFFATTVITTIGYGNMAPVTLYGRIFCIGFGLFGIPLLLVTIADIGKFLSDFLSFLYRTYRNFKRKLRKHSRRLSRKHSRSRTNSLSTKSPSDSPNKAGSPAMPLDDDESEASSDDELRIPVVMVMLVLVGYTAIGGALFNMWEGWQYFDSFYFCFITMATIGFGDLVPSKQMFMFFTMAYIVMGLALATMCIDLAGTEYIRKIHYVGQKMENAKELVGGAVVSGLHAGEHLLKHTGYGFIRTAQGRLVAVGDSMLRRRYDLDEDFMDEFVTHNILYEPVSASVAKLAREGHIRILPNEIGDSEGYVLTNKTFNKPPKRGRTPYVTMQRHRGSWLRRVGSEPVLMVAPFVLKESNV